MTTAAHRYLGQFRASSGRVDYVMVVYDDTLLIAPSQLLNSLVGLVAGLLGEELVGELSEFVDQYADGIGHVVETLLSGTRESVEERIRTVYGHDRFALAERTLDSGIATATPDQLRARFRFASLVPSDDIVGAGFLFHRRKVLLRIQTRTHRWYGLIRTVELEIPTAHVARCRLLLQHLLPGRLYNTDLL